MPTPPPDLDALAQARAGQLERTPALCRLDGLVWGLCAAGETRGTMLLETAALRGPVTAATALLRSCRNRLSGAPGLPDPLLPTDAAPLPERALCLADWCRGVLDGLHAQPERVAMLSATALEAYGDLDAIARTGQAGRGRAEEEAYALLVEHARVTLALLASELPARPDAAGAGTLSDPITPPEAPDAAH